jgi:hypothetical protein
VRDISDIFVPAMQNLLKYITAISLSALLVLSTISFMVNMHFCGTHLVDIAINDKAHGCGMLMGGDENSPLEMAMPDMGCCENVHFAITGQDDLQVANTDCAMVIPMPPGVVADLPQAPFLSTQSQPAFNPYYHPPPPSGNRLVLYQVFRI